MLWSLVLFFGCSIVFQAIKAVASSGGRGLVVAIQALVAVALIGTIVLVQRMKR